ncbi:MAG: hypothetical protein KC609_04485 [Myxococcales bacterium]|nr:hypothetical protein [Myxococcales bacterium]
MRTRTLLFCASLLVLILGACGTSKDEFQQSESDQLDPFSDIVTPSADQLPGDEDADRDAVDLQLPPPIDIPGPGLAIRALHDETHADHPAPHSVVTLKGVIATTRVAQISNGFLGFFVQDPNENGAQTGVLVVFFATDFNPTITRGTRVDLQGEYLEWYGMTQVVAKQLQLVGSSTEPAPIDVELSSLNPGSPARELYEGSLIRVTGVTVSRETDNYGEFELEGGLLVDDLFVRFQARPGQTLATLTGVLNYSFGQFKLEPRDPKDFGACNGAGCSDDAFETPNRLADDCGDIGYEGRCENNVVVWCDNGVLKRTNCDDFNGSCGWDTQSLYFVCIPQGSECGDVTYAGRCDGTTLKYCDFNTLKSVDCAATAKTCGTNDQGLFDCLP